MAKRKIKMQQVRLAGVALAALVLLIVFAQNLESQTVQILFLQMTMPLAILLVGTAILGYLIGLLSAGVLLRQRKSKPTDSAEA
ncbi:MAG: DUF1049 domain-containing protein [Planctomycetes bacterium]|nr:DUF1049 domain-containing protein [Planctomycetota bacterium]